MSASTGRYATFPSSSFRLFFLRFFFDSFIASAEYRRDESASASRRSLERAESDIACWPRGVRSVENSRECGYVLLSRTQCYSFTELIISPLKEEAKWSS